ncbi:hypothetical protein ACFXPT_39515, partial [Streptomyces goshikiensis]|uniref:hypothetical protein n=1 Tax=Streptomyces goshikiensis TaxID=1942 RepID=UPI0036784CE5
MIDASDIDVFLGLGVGKGKRTTLQERNKQLCWGCSRGVVGVSPVSVRHSSLMGLWFWILWRSCRSWRMRWSGSVKAVLAWVVR